MNGSSFQIFVFIPTVQCDICHRESFYPPGIWKPEWDRPLPPSLTLVPNLEVGMPNPTFAVQGAVTESEAVGMALKNGWKFATPIKIACPKCQKLISEITGIDGLWERGK